jgi:asparagine synthase (glutamine-hydrolysing)
MCGIFALFLNHPLTEQDISLGRAGVKALTHRGPDEGGEWLDTEKGIFLGHRRLSIIDLTDASHQPMVRDDLVLSYNGEIYNYRTLRERLEGLGASFASTGDTEVLLRAWQILGRRALDAVDGMFAFAIWDGDDGWLAVDPFGEKQLYYAQTSEGVYVSSELTPLQRLLRATPDLSADQLTPFVTLGYVPAPETIYPAIKRLSPAGIIRIRHGHADDLDPYWRPLIGEPRVGPPKPLTSVELDNLQEVLVESVQGRLESDVPACLFLSSGIDSVLVAAIASRELMRNLDCITIRFPGGDTHDESDNAAVVAKMLGINHTVLTSPNYSENLTSNEILELFGQPHENLTVAAVRQMATEAKEKGYSVGLTGMGGDELFFGYAKHTSCYRNRTFYNLPEWMRIALAMTVRPIERLSNRVGAFCYLFGVRNFERYPFLKNIPAGLMLRELPNYKEWAAARYSRYAQPFELVVPAIDLEDTLPNSQLPAYDVGSMRASLELRTPFLSRKLQELVASFDPRSFLAFGRKSVARRMLNRYLPEGTIDRAKRGFVYPPERFIRQYGNATPFLNGLPKPVVSQIWSRRSEKGWHRLATRLVLANDFPAWLEANGADSSSLRRPESVAAAIR